MPSLDGIIPITGGALGDVLGDVCFPEQLVALGSVCTDYRQLLATSVGELRTQRSAAIALLLGISSRREAHGEVAIPGAMHELVDTKKLMWNDAGISSPAKLIALGTVLRSRALIGLTEVYLDYNRFGQDGMVALAQALPTLPNLTLLNLGVNQIGDVGAAALAKTLRNGALPVLTALLLYENMIGDAGLEALVSAAGSRLSCLRILQVGQNRIGNAGMRSLATAWEQGAFPKLMVLSLQENPIGSDGVNTLASAVKEQSVSPVLCVELDDELPEHDYEFDCQEKAQAHYTACLHLLRATMLHKLALFRANCAAANSAAARVEPV